MEGVSRRLVVAIAVTIAVAWAALLPRPAAADREADLKALRRAIVESRDRVATYGNEERGLLDALDALDRSIAILTREVTHAAHRAQKARNLLREIESEAAVISGRLEQTRRAMSTRAAALYRAGELGAVRMLFSAESLRDFLSRVYALRLLLVHDAELIARHRSESEALSLAESRARDASVRNEEAAAGLRERSTQLAAERATKQRLVAQVHGDRARERTALVEFETAARALEEMLAGLGASPQRALAAVPGPAFASQRGALRPPVPGSIVGEFGRVVDSEFQTETYRKGVHFEARRGTPVRAVARGRVSFAGWFRGYGRLVILDHGDQYFTISGHLDALRVEVGQAVNAGRVIGTVGETGSLAGPRLYFEVRRGGQPQDPRRWLASRQAG
jgi:septal ring factor EnvC (AmiA/AmiB activator)